MNSNAIKNGLILGAIGTAIFFIIYVIDITLLSDWKVSIPWLVLSVVLYFVFAFQMRKDEGGFMTFKKAFISTFVMIMVAGVFSLAFRVVLYEVIDPEIPEQLKQATIEQVEIMYESMGVSESPATIQALEDLEEKDFSMSPKNIGMELLTLAGGGIFFALIIGAIVKKKPPMGFLSDDVLDD